MDVKKPIISVMGHVDHGKSQLIDYLCGTNNISGEAGGITQNIRLHNIDSKYPLDAIMIDTPGHQVFDNIRKMAIYMADLIIVVIDAQKGPQEETKKILEMAKNKEIVIVFSKIDLGIKHLEKIYGSLAQLGCVVDSIGGDVPTIQLSALTGENINDLVEYLQLSLDNKNIEKTSENKAIVIDVYQKNKEYYSTLWLQSGQINSGDYFSCGSTHGRIKNLEDNKKPVKSVNVNSIVTCAGYDSIPRMGDVLIIHKNKKIAISQADNQRHINFGTADNMSSDEKSEHKLILKADTMGHLETLISISHRHQILSQSIGIINNKEIQIIKTNPDAKVISFGKLSRQSIKILDNLPVPVKYYHHDVIYKLKDMVTYDVESVVEEKLSDLEIIRVFVLSNKTHIAGSKVISGKITTGNLAKIIRKGKEIVKNLVVSSLQKDSDKIQEGIKGHECGIIFKQNNNLYSDIKLGDKIIVYKSNNEVKSLSIYQ